MKQNTVKLKLDTSRGPSIFLDGQVFIKYAAQLYMQKKASFITNQPNATKI